jgi:hypothetical protein
VVVIPGAVDNRNRAATMIIMIVVAAYLLTRRAADFARAEPRDLPPATDAIREATPRSSAASRPRTLELAGLER